MVVTELDLERVTVLEAKADAPLIVDRDGMLTGAIKAGSRLAIWLAERI